MRCFSVVDHPKSAFPRLLLGKWPFMARRARKLGFSGLKGHPSPKHSCLGGPANPRGPAFHQSWPRKRPVLLKSGPPVWLFAFDGRFIRKRIKTAQNANLAYKALLLYTLKRIQYLLYVVSSTHSQHTARKPSLHRANRH